MNTEKGGNEEEKPNGIVAFDEDQSSSLAISPTGSKIIKYEHDEERTARLEREKLQLAATLEKKKTELDAKLLQEKEDKNLVRQQTRYRFFVCLGIYVICFLIFAYFSVFGDAAAIAWARPALLAMVGGVTGYAVGKTESSERKT